MMPSSSSLGPKRYRRRLAASRVPDSVWDFLEEHFYQPIVIFLAAFVLAALWLVALEKAAKVVVWSTIACDIALVFFIFIWFSVKAEMVNVPCLVIGGIMIVCAVVFYKKVNYACAVVSTAMKGLFANKVAFLACFGVQLVWAAFFAIWVGAIVTAHFVREVDFETCGLQVSSFTNSGWLMTYFALHYFWVTYFMRNINTILITFSVAGWYFQEQGFEGFWRPALRWAVGPLAGSNAICAAIMGLSEYLLGMTSSKWRLIFAVLNPVEWIFLLVALVFKTFLQTYTKFGLIACAYSGRPFCETAPRAVKLLQNWLGQMVVTDYLGKTVMKWVTYVISLAVAFTAWAWADAVQDINTLQAFTASGIVVVMMVYAWILSYPFLGLICVILFEQFLGHLNWPNGIQALWNSILASLFMGCITFFMLAFLSQIVVTAMDVSLFCYAVESDIGQKQERLGELYEGIKHSVVDGTTLNQNKNGSAVGAMMSVIAPEGAIPGKEMSVQSPAGNVFTAIIPEGVSAGQEFQVQIPVAATPEAATVVGQPAAQREMDLRSVVVVDDGAVPPSGDSE